MAVTELRLVVTTDDYDNALDFFRDVLGLAIAANYDTEDGRVIDGTEVVTVNAATAVGRVNSCGRRSAGRRGRRYGFG